MVLDDLKKALRESVGKIMKSVFVDKALIREVIRDLQRALLKADVDVSLVVELSKRIEERAIKEREKGVAPRSQVLKVLYEELVRIVGKKKELSLGKHRIMLVGLYGQGKTTSAAKIALYYRKKGLRVGLIEADVHRPGAYDQLRQLAEKIGVPFFGIKGEKNAVKIVKKGLKELQGVDIVIVDTSGRHRLEKDLIEEMERVKKALDPDEIWLVLDATIGQSAKDHVKAFHESVGITGVVLTKMDGSAKGGGALTAAAMTGAPIVFIGTGEHVEDIEPFDPDSFISRLLGFGDVKALMKELEQTIDQKKAEEISKRIFKGKITMEDVYEQLEALTKMGPLRKVLDMLPLGSGLPQLNDEQIRMTQEKLMKFKVIISSMTKEERQNPSIIRHSRIRRIARGSGTSEKDVQELLRYYENMKTMFKRIGRNRKLRRALMKQLKLT